MSSRVLDFRNDKKLQPSTLLWAGYNPAAAPLRFTARTPAESAKWRVRIRKELADALGFQTLPPVALSPRRLERVDKGDYIREKILLRTSRLSVMPVYILIPKVRRAPSPAVIAFHGHGYGVKDIVGLWENGDERDTPDGYHKDFAVALCRRGFVVAAPEISCFGERQSDFNWLHKGLGSPVPSTCTQAAFLAFHQGGTAAGLRVHDGIKLADYLQTRPEIDPEAIGAMGISGGGMHTFFSTCLDNRIKAAVISGYFSTFKDSILAMHHCPCNFVPGLGRFGEMSDLAGLIAPRPILIEAGIRDNIFPLPAVKKGVAAARKNYALSGAPADAIELDVFDGRHQISGRLSYDFLARKLGLTA
jgi:dienelactone hydrolase